MVPEPQSQQPQMNLSGSHDLMISVIPTIISCFRECSLEKHNTTLYHGESSHANQLRGNDHGNDMEPESYIPEEHTQDLNQSDANADSISKSFKNLQL